MNFLAHLFFADPTPDSYVGNLLGDFTKGVPDQIYSKDVIKGIYLHRAIDYFTDTHPVVIQSKRLMHSDRRRLAGILVDVFYDYFLSHHWQKYHALSLDVFIQQVYFHLKCYQGHLPEKAYGLLDDIVDNDWLRDYGRYTGVDETLKRIATRLRYKPYALATGIIELETHYSTLETHFHEFFPQLILFSKNHNK